MSRSYSVSHHRPVPSFRPHVLLWGQRLQQRPELWRPEELWAFAGGAAGRVPESCRRGTSAKTQSWSKHLRHFRFLILFLDLTTLHINLWKSQRVHIRLQRIFWMKMRKHHQIIQSVCVCACVVSVGCAHCVLYVGHLCLFWPLKSVTSLTSAFKLLDISFHLGHDGGRKTRWIRS